MGSISEASKLSDHFRGTISYKEKDQDRFFGRDDEIVAAVEKLEQYRTVVLSGASGCGKTSLLLAGIVPELRLMRLDAGARFSPGFPVVVRDWGTFKSEVKGALQSDLAGFSNFVANAVRTYVDRPDKPEDSLNVMVQYCKTGVINNLPASDFEEDVRRFADAVSIANHDVPVRGIDDLEGFIRHVVNRCGGLTLVFDQLEELLRINSKFIQTVNTTISRLRMIKGVWIVLSLREEYLTELRKFELMGSSRDQTIFLVPKMRVEAAEKVFQKLCDSINAGAGRERVRIEPGMIADLESQFSQLDRELKPMSGAAEQNSSTVELIYLSGILRQLVRRLERRKDDGVRVLSLEILRKAFGDDRQRVGDTRTEAQKSTTHHPILSALTSIFDDCFEPDASAPFKRFVAAKIASSMSSGGYKLSQMQDHLYKEVFSERIKFLQDDEIKAALLRLESWTILKTNSDDPASPRQTLGATISNEFRKCLADLEDDEILKHYVAADARSLWELTHDRLGVPFVLWADEQRHTFDDCLADPLGSRGISPMRVPSSGAGGDRSKPVGNLSWLGCYLEPERDAAGKEADNPTLLKDFVFENCEFSGTVFERLIFDNCDFVQCRFNGSLFKRCTFRNTKFVRVGREKERPGGFTLGFLGCTFQEGNQFNDCKFTQPAFGGPKIESDVQFSKVEIHLGALEEPDGRGGNFQFDKESAVEWTRWDQSFDARIIAPKGVKKENSGVPKTSA